MQHAVTGSFAALTLWVALGSAETPAPRTDRTNDGRASVPSNIKQAANKLPTRTGFRAFSDADESRAVLSEPSERRLSSGTPIDRVTPVTDTRISTRALRDSSATRDGRLARPEAGEKVNRPSESIEKRFLTAPDAPRTRIPDPGQSKANRLDRQSGGR